MYRFKTKKWKRKTNLLDGFKDEIDEPRFPKIKPLEILLYREEVVL